MGLLDDYIPQGNNSGAVGASKSKTEAPTNAGTLEAQKPKMTPQQLDFVTLIAYYHGLHGVVLSAQKAAELYEVEEQDYLRWISQEKVLSALEERGITVPGSRDGVDTERPRFTSQIVSPQQLIVANALLDLNDTRSDKKKLQDLGISTAKYQSWLKDPTFRHYIQTRAENMLGDNQHQASMALMDKVNMGDIKAIQFYMEYTGRFVPKNAADVNTNNLDFKNLITKFVEIIIDEVDDPDTAARLADRLKTLVSANAVTEAIMEPEIIVPQITKSRVLTPELEAKGLQL